MASANSYPAANTVTLLYTQAGIGGTVNISACRQKNDNAMVGVAITPNVSSSPANADWIVFNDTSFIQRFGERIDAGWKIWVISNTGTVSFRVCSVDDLI